MRSAQVHHIRSKELIALGRSLQLASAEAATGRCLTTVLEFAALAQDRRIEVDLVKWQVHDDPLFADHWAVQLDAERVIDPTRMQVDGTDRLVCGLDHYPANYRRRRAYPARLLLPSYRRLARDCGAARVPGRFLAGCQARLLAFDVVCGLAELGPLRVGAAFVEAGRFALSTGGHAARRRFEARATALEQRLKRLEDSRPDLRTAPGRR